MSYTCDWPGCSNPIKFRLDTTGLQIPAGKVSFTPAEIGKKLNDSLKDITPPIIVPTPNPAIFNYCDDHWMEKAKKWAEDERTECNLVVPEDYRVSRAKTTAEGIFIQNNNEAFLQNIRYPPNPNEDPQVIPIVSCFVHEIHHFWSFNSRGLQGHKEGTDWDEGICEWLSFPVYSSTMRGKPIPGGSGTITEYCTPYKNYMIWNTTGVAKWVRAVNGWWANIFLKEDDRRAHLPNTLDKYFENATPGTPGHGTKTEAMWLKALRLMMANWFFKGQGTAVEGYKDFADFIHKRNDVFVGQVGPSFGGIDETIHKILDPTKSPH